MSNLALGIDIGGTNVKMGVVRPDGEVVGFDIEPTPHSPPDSAISIVVDGILGFVDDHGLDIGSFVGIGIGFAGSIRRPEGIVEAVPNLRLWGGVPLKRIISERMGREVEIDNDANLAALGEYTWGKEKGSDPLVLFTLGTGIGGGIIVNGGIFHGNWGGAAELGHQTIEVDGRPCSCGNRGCLEAYCGSKAVIARAWRLLKRDKGSLLWDTMGGNFGSLDAEMIGEAARNGDPAANTVVKETAEFLGVAVANIMNIINPECVLLAGGLTGWGRELLLMPLTASAKRHSLKAHFNSCKIAISDNGIRAGVLGAAALAFSASDKSQ